MGVLNKTYEWLVSKPLRTAQIAAYTVLGGQVLNFFHKNGFRRPTIFDERPGLVEFMLPALAALFATSIGCQLLNTFATPKDKYAQPHKLRDFKTIKTLEKIVRAQKRPSIFFNGEGNIKYGILDALRWHYLGPIKAEKHARNTKNPIELMFASLSYMGRHGKFDLGLECLKDAIDMLGNKKPKVVYGAGLKILPVKLAIKFAYKIGPRHIGNYIVSAAYASILCPEDAWFYGALGKLAADTFQLNGKTELYVVHALLATMQKRSDESDAWKETMGILNQSGTKNRIGESRHPVWEIADSSFFKNTLVLKGNADRRALENEVASARELETILGDTAKVPHPLYITQEPVNGDYIYSMLRLPGKTLGELIEKEDYSALEEINSVLARIHAKYPTEKLTKIDLAGKTERKLKEMGIEQDLVNLILANISPVHEAIEKDAPIVAIKDAHPGNWEILPEAPHIGVLDTEITEKGPAMLDAANLYGFADKMTTQEKLQYVMDYVAKLQKEGVHAYYDTPFTRHAYFNGEIQRMGIDLIGAWSAPDRQSLHEERPKLAGRAIRAIESLETTDKRYQELKKSFEAIQKALS